MCHLSIDEEIVQNTAGAPSDAVSPAFDTRGALLVNEDVTTSNKLSSLPVMGTTGNMWTVAAKGSFDEHEGIPGRFEEANVAGDDWNRLTRHAGH